VELKKKAKIGRGGRRSTRKAREKERIQISTGDEVRRRLHRQGR
jgi:hypothetical protein